VVKPHKQPAKGRQGVAIAFRMRRLQPPRAVFAGGFAAAAALALFAAPAHALPRCSSSISSCCRITRSGDYTVTQPLSTSGGSCLVVAAPNVKLDLAGKSLTGGGTSSGIGLDALSSAGHLIVVGGGSLISKFGTGVRNDAGAVKMINLLSFFNGVGLVDTGSNAIFDSFTANENAQQGALFTHASMVRAVVFQTDSDGGDGLVLNAVRNSTFDLIAEDNAGNGLTIKGGSGNSIIGEMSSNKADGAVILNSHNNTLSSPLAQTNTGNGLTIKGGSSNSILDVQSGANHGDGVAILNSSRDTVQLGGVADNTGVGIHIGCQPSNMPVSSGCHANAPSNDNVVDDILVQDDGWGIVIDEGNHRNGVIRNIAGSNTNDDLLDDNPGCDSNIWLDNTFGGGTVSPTCN
jgi:Right handed beta helix region